MNILGKKIISQKILALFKINYFCKIQFSEVHVIDVSSCVGNESLRFLPLLSVNLKRGHDNDEQSNRKRFGPEKVSLSPSFQASKLVVQNSSLLTSCFSKNCYAN